ncbi:MAG: 2-amino-4-hydroxy-6-hydroxymethyldihydropteridine diphosphokinase [Puniceicoccales bacterium]|jgi:2-amino-4-hydroxy-6-hydroxymethyldihydropteridine diphosphokinase|nr:2-amino-4-hydroxy-6-hydroxymethyldihydropteridine diphosphokinase [Puniceicoccales bacterium]
MGNNASDFYSENFSDGTIGCAGKKWQRKSSQPPCVEEVTGWSLAILGLGSNLGDREVYLKRAAELIGCFSDTKIMQKSSIHCTAPLLLENQPEFLNQSLLIATALSPEGLLEETQGVENALGRVRLEKYGSRTMDVDILLFGSIEIATPTLQIPHPHLRRRRFWLEELKELGIVLVPEDETVLQQRCENFLH